MECFRLLLEHLAWLEHEFLSGIRDSRKAGNLWGVMRGVGGVRKSEHQSCVPTGHTVNKEYYVEVLRESRKRFCRKRPALFKLGQQYFHQDNTPVHNSILVTDYLTKMGIKTFPHTPYSPNVGPSDFWLLPKLRGCRYETIEEMKEVMTKVIDTLTQDDFHGAFQKLLERYNKCIAAGGDYFERDQSFMCVLSIKVPIRKKSGNLCNDPLYIYYFVNNGIAGTEELFELLFFFLSVLDSTLLKLIRTSELMGSPEHIRSSANQYTIIHVYYAT